MITPVQLKSMSAEQLREARAGDQDGLFDRLARVLMADSAYRLGEGAAAGLRSVIEPFVLDEGRGGQALRIFRAVPAGARLRPGDWVALSRDYAQTHLRGDSTAVITQAVPVADVLWAGTDENEFIYAPARLAQPEASSLWEAIQALSEQHLAEAIGHPGAARRRQPNPAATILREVMPILRETFALDWASAIHGLPHWSRVWLNARLLCAEYDVNPEIGAWFAYLHDIRREDDCYDLEHGPRAADFASELRAAGIIRLERREFDWLREALTGHSDGEVCADRAVQVCWDADRLDLGRVDIYPDPQYLCTPLARDPDFIARAYARSVGQRQRAHLDEEAGPSFHAARWR